MSAPAPVDEPNFDRLKPHVAEVLATLLPDRARVALTARGTEAPA
jgi:hypothetical protein